MSDNWYVSVGWGLHEQDDVRDLRESFLEDSKLLTLQDQMDVGMGK